tara:strand:- start:2269 stop:2913 length:645 start_codon:yes stop_codon:yes gene_type:complete
MKVKIKKDGKQETYNIVESWKEVTLEKFISINLDVNNKSKTKEAKETIALLSNLPNEIINELSLKNVVLILDKLAEVQTETKGILEKIYVIDGVEYGFHPDLSEITLGEYADIETFVNRDLQKHLPEIMAILFRPVVAKEQDVYTIEAYDGDISLRAEKMRKMNAEQVQSALVFFWIFVKVFVAILPLSLIRAAKTKMNKFTEKVSPKSGAGLV